MLVKFEVETPINIWSDEFVCPRSKMYSFNCGDDSKHKLKSFSKSQSKRIEFEEYKNCLFGGEYQKECVKYNFCSINHELYLHEVNTSTLSLFYDKRCYINETENKPWN